MLVDHDPFAQSLGSSGANIVRLQHLEHRCAGQPAVLRQIQQRQRERRQNQVSGDVELRLNQLPSNRTSRMPDTGKQVEDRREQDHEQETGQEHWYRETDQGQHGSNMTPGTFGTTSGEDADQHANDDGEDQRGAHQQIGRPQPSADEFGDGLIEEERVAEVTGGDLADVTAELLMNGSSRP